MKLMLIGFAFLGAMSISNTAAAEGTLDEEVIYCTENSCLVRSCTTVYGSTSCSTAWVPRLPINGPGYPEEP